MVSTEYYLDQPLVAAYMRQFRDLPPQELGVQVRSPDGQSGILSVWAVEIRGGKGQVKRAIIPLAVDEQGRRLLVWERQPEKYFRAEPASENSLSAEAKLALLREKLEPMLQREIAHRGLAMDCGGFEATLIGWVEVTP